MKWTDDQAKVIDARKQNILVSAAAGSGKTAVLVERIKKMIIEDHIPLKSMLIVTFTNAAAAEMKQKIIDSISRELDEKDDGFLRAQLQDIHKANISTFHSFAISVLRRYYHMVDIEPSFGICEDTQKEVLTEKAIDDVFSEMFAEGSVEFRNFMNSYSKSNSEDETKAMVKTTYNFIQSLPEPFEWLDEKVEMLALDKAEFIKTQAFAEYIQSIQAELSKCKLMGEAYGKYLEEQGIDSLVPKVWEDVGNVDTLINLLENGEYSKFLVYLRDFKFITATVAKVDKEAHEAIRAQSDFRKTRFRDKLKSIYNFVTTTPLEEQVGELNDTYDFAKILCSLVREYGEKYMEYKMENNVLDFNDVEHMALEVLKDENVSEEYRKKFKFIFIDEYQDSNYVQDSLIKRVCNPDNVFMVGDVKQSIYKFRLAEPELFIEKYNNSEDREDIVDRRIDLNRNFRSKRGIIDTINNLFEHLMDADLSGMVYDDKASLYLGLDYDPKWDEDVNLTIIDEKKSTKFEDLEDLDPEIDALSAMELEAKAAADIVKENLNTTIYDAKKLQERKLKFKDIVILMRSVSSGKSAFSEVFQSQGLPIYIESGEGYFDTLEIETFINLLKVIDNKRQDIPMVSTMYSPIFGFSTEDLIKIRLHHKEDEFYKAFLDYTQDGADEELKAKCISMLERLEKWRQDEAFMSLDEFLWMLMQESKYYDYAGALTRGELRRANLKALIDRSVDFGKKAIGGLYEFLNYIDTLKAKNIQMPQAELLSENDDVVRVTTIHKSKGLEYPMVIVAGLGKKFINRPDEKRLNLHKDIGITLSWEDYDNRTFKNTILKRMIDIKKRREELAEEVRVLYVALTRAMDKLHLIGSINPYSKDLNDLLQNQYMLNVDTELDITGTKTYLDMLLPILKMTNIKERVLTRFDISNMDEIQAFDLDFSLLEQKDDTQSDQDRKKLRDDITRRIDFVYPHKKALSLKSKYSVSELNKDLSRDALFNKPSLTVSYGLDEDTSISAAEKGTILHTAFEKLDFAEARENKDNRDYFMSFVKDLVENEFMSEDEAGTISVDALKNFAANDIMNRIVHAEKVWKETPFNLKVTVDGERVDESGEVNEEIIVQGIIDCHFLENGEYVLIDYKSNRVNPGDTRRIEDIRQLYKSQMRFYKEALEKIKGVRVKETYIYLTEIDETLLM